MLTAVLALFSIGAVINALAPTIEVLIAGRVLQGVAGGVFPLAFGIIRDTFPRDQVAGGLSIISAVFGIGGGIGLPLSGVIVDNARPRLAVLDQPVRGARGGRGAPASSRRRRRSSARAWTGSAPRCCRAAWPRSCSASRSPAAGAGARRRRSAASPAASR